MRIQQSRNMEMPSYADNEISLGFQSEQIYIPDGLRNHQVQMIKVPNTRPTPKYIEEKIRNYWPGFIEDRAKELRDAGLNIEIENANGRPNAIYEIMPDGEKIPLMFDGDRARFEGAEFDSESQRARIFWSEEKYSAHDALRHTNLPKPYQAQLFTINGTLICNYQGDEVVVIGERDTSRTDQGAIPLFVPAGFVDTLYLGTAIGVEGFDEATMRKLLDELHIPGMRYSEDPFRATERESGEELNAFPVRKEDLKLLSIIYNSFKNHDTTAIVAIHSGLDYEDIQLKGKEHTGKFPISLKYGSLVDFLYELSQNFETNSGHLRGGIASLIGHKHGMEAYKQALEDVIIRLDKR